MTGSVSLLIEELRNGDPDAATELWARFIKRVAGLAAARLSSGRRRAADEEDVAVSVFCRLFDGIQAGRFPNLHDRHDLWALLAEITAAKATDLLRHERRKKRGGGRLRGESAFLKLSPRESGYDGIDQMMSKELTPEFDVLMRDLLDLLQDDERQLALLKLAGYSTAEIKDKIPAMSVRTIERKLNIIRQKWRREWEAITLPPNTRRPTGTGPADQERRTLPEPGERTEETYLP